jgi:hypothetical protein
MIADSPYAVEELALPPWVGAVAGVTGALVMLLPLAWLSAEIPPAVGSPVDRLLWVAGNGPVRFHQALLGPGGGLLLHLGIGGTLGLLYAASQRRAPVRGLAAVGIFFGFLLWVVSGPILGGLLGEQMAGDFRSLAWAAACITFGVFLSVITMTAQKRRAARAVSVVPKD